MIRIKNFKVNKLSFANCYNLLLKHFVLNIDYKKK